MYSGHSCALVHGDWFGTWSVSDCLDSRAYICKFALQVDPSRTPPAAYPPPPGTQLAPPMPPPPGFVYGTPTNYSLAYGTPLSVDGVHEYIFFNTPMTWDNAQAACIRNQAELAYIETLSEWQAVVGHFEEVRKSRNVMDVYLLAVSYWFCISIFLRQCLCSPSSFQFTLTLLTAPSLFPFAIHNNGE